MQSFISNSAAETLAAGQRFAASLPNSGAGRVVELVGGFGAGKTLFAKGVLQGLGFKGDVTSPSYTYAKEYQLAELKVVHLDLWRVSGVDLDFWRNEISNYIRPGNLVLIEWGRAVELPGKIDWTVELTELEGVPDGRQIVIKP